MSANQACGSSSNATLFLRAYSVNGTDHFYTTDHVEMEAAVSSEGYTSQGNAGWVFTTQVGATIPLYRLFNSAITDHFYTTNETERDSAISQDGYVFEEIAAYVYATQVCNGIPLYRLYSSSLSDHFYTINATEMNVAATTEDYVEEGIQCFVLPNALAESTQSSTQSPTQSSAQSSLQTSTQTPTQTPTQTSTQTPTPTPVSAPKSTGHVAAIVAPIVAVVFVSLVIVIYLWFQRRKRALRAKSEARGDGEVPSASLLPTSNSVDAVPQVGIPVVDAEVSGEDALDLDVEPKPEGERYLSFANISYAHSPPQRFQQRLNRSS
ncbi:hypothetical protein POSPLADRAFT_1051214 [Postia placenta MAD-698-R-SB12]|uniref:DUF5648 domain-containing protein n=1 Tax=Postia placenta MAD-698-R-SB12 TaxID=670580 RepID=A0A1X6NEJ2_9APHY|nr:hypothetical protein POSPLADRAFT_1051214 [Postia placenta MAD-698-R-SB12]OSX67059.1 hypothetical protein POSPLADRAFT_1051214 [Postia placenta MAD-698-R-SB12]